MNRKTFLYSMTALGAGIYSLSELEALHQSLPTEGKLMPVIFFGHGSPMNGIEDNVFSQEWKKLAADIPRPRAILMVSAHWLTQGTWVTAMDKPETIHDFGGFPQALFDVQYHSPGSPTVAQETIDAVKSIQVKPDHEWGLDHGTWTVLRHMYPDADIPVLQLSIDITQPAAFHYKLASELASLRKKGVLIAGSGNMVHNLGMVAWDKLDKPEFGYDWALEINQVFKQKITSRDHQALIDYQKLGQAAWQAIPTPDHYYPLLYTLGLQQKNEETQFFNDKAVGGSLTMTSVLIR